MPNEKDIAEKFLEAKNDVFADIVNVLLFNGREVVKEDELEPTLLRSQFKGDGGLHEQERDVAKFWKNGKICIALYGLENQTKPDPDMPFRVISYDGASYKEQLIQRSRGGKAEPFYPVVTLVLYFGTARWNYPTALLDSLGEGVSAELLPYVSDYKINVFEIAHLTPEQVRMFKSDFRIVADYFVQMARNEEYIPSTDEIRHVDELLKLLSALTGNHRFEDVYNEEHYQKGEPVTMYDVFTDYENRGRVKGLAEGEAKGRAEGEAKGRAEGTLLTLCRLVKRGLLSPAAAAEDAGMNEQDFLAKMEQAYPG